MRGRHRPDVSCVGIGGDPVIGNNFVEYLQLFEEDPETKAVVMIGELGGTRRRTPRVHRADVQAGGGLHQRQERPAGEANGPRRRHLLREGGGAPDKVRALEAAGALMAETLVDIVRLTEAALK